MALIRTGIGYDIHRLVRGRKLIIGGVEIPYEKGLLGHSDADVLVHAVIDALFGAAALGDIGAHFPDTDERYKDANSMMLLQEACAELAEHGYEIVNVDSNIIIQSPKMAPYINLMRENIAKALKTDIDNVSVKAKTNEKFDSQGNGESVSAQAVCLIAKW